jgi:hypothetical protein
MNALSQGSGPEDPPRPGGPDPAGQVSRGPSLRLRYRQGIRCRGGANPRPATDQRARSEDRPPDLYGIRQRPVKPCHCQKPERKTHTRSQGQALE